MLQSIGMRGKSGNVVNLPIVPDSDTFVQAMATGELKAGMYIVYKGALVLVANDKCMIGGIRIEEVD